jgi:ankyrin repeat protein
MSRPVTSVRSAAYGRGVLAADDERVAALIEAVQAGDHDRLAQLLAEHPEVATERHGDAEMSRTALHVVADWPGHWSNGAQSVALLVAAGAPVDGRFAGPHRETPLHWAASSDDVAVLDALIDAGADIEADGAVLTGGTPLADAVVYAQWAAARRLVERGAVMTIWQAAALGEVAALEGMLAGTAYEQADLDNACWHACRAGRAACAQVLVERGADVEWRGYEGLTTRAAGMQAGDPALEEWLAAR